jgi:hypothetical protein
MAASPIPNSLDACRSVQIPAMDLFVLDGSFGVPQAVIRARDDDDDDDDKITPGPGGGNIDPDDDEGFSDDDDEDDDEDETLWSAVTANGSECQASAGPRWRRDRPNDAKPLGCC